MELLKKNKTKICVFVILTKTLENLHIDQNGRLIFIQSFDIVEITSLGVEHKKTAMNC